MIPKAIGFAQNAFWNVIAKKWKVKMQNYEWFALTLMLIFIMSGIALTLYKVEEIEGNMKQYIELTGRCQLYNTSNLYSTRVNGIYYYDGYYCVWTANRTTEDIADTETHEKCHALIDKDGEHFCGGQDGN